MSMVLLSEMMNIWQDEQSRKNDEGRQTVRIV